jgi:ketosteroid isomerase-like protein
MVGTAEENTQIIRRGYEAFSRGDLAALTDVLADGVVWHVAGRNRLSGREARPRRSPRLFQPTGR